MKRWPTMEELDRRIAGWRSLSLDVLTLRESVWKLRRENEQARRGITPPMEIAPMTLNEIERAR